MSKDIVIETVPIVTRRIGDNVIANQNNSTIILGRDRLNSIDSGYGNMPNAGSIHAVVGRKNENPSVNDDAATLYISSKTDPDEHINTKNIENEQKEKSGAILKADCIRISSRVDIKISVGKSYIYMSDDKIVLDSNISLGKGAKDRVILGDAFADFWKTVTIPTPAGLSGTPPPLPEYVFSKRTVKAE